MRAFISSRIGIALSIAIAIIVVATVYKYSNGSQSVSTRGNGSIAIDKLVLASLDRDDDGDGLKNWEEELYKTDILNPDTDSDGIGDNEEALLGQDPTIAEPEGDSTEPTVKPVFTATDKLSQEILQKYVEMKQLGLEIDVNISDQIAKSILVQDYSDIKQAYTEEDIKRSDESFAGIKRYGNELGRVLQTPRTGQYMELDIFPRLATESVETYKGDLLTLKNRYIKMRDSILAIPTPNALRKAQSQIANSIGVFIDSIDGALAIETDPIGSLTKIGRYTFGLQSVDVALLEVRNYLKSNGVTYSPSESGYILLQ
jgi:hypothetical protein